MNSNLIPLKAGDLKKIIQDAPDDMDIMLQRLDDASLIAGFNVKKITFEILDYTKVDQEVLKELGIQEESLVEEYVMAASAHINKEENLMLINFN